MKKEEIRKTTKDSAPNFLHLMGDNGWTWQTYDGWAGEDHFRYSATFLGLYHTEVCACVAANYKHIRVNGHLGIMWLEATDYPDCSFDKNHGYDFNDLFDMLNCMILAEENLVRCGIPFCPDYSFHGPNKANLKRRNDATRRKLNLEHWEEIAWDEANEGTE